MTRLLTLALALAFAALSASVAVESAPATLGGPKVEVLAQLSLPPMGALPTRFGGSPGGVLGDRK